jgi:protein-S-isoprenylcysteine O-methyltransferase Ste14
MDRAGSVLLFLIPLLLGFAANVASAFTSAWSRRLGDRWGAVVTIALRGMLGIPVWAFGLALAFRTPSAELFPPTGVTRGIGWLVIAAGAVLIVMALVTLRRTAMLPSTHDALVQTGLYAHLRHPIHAGTGLEFAGLFLLAPTWAVLLACALGIGWLLAQTRAEEHDLLQRLPEYRGYMQRVPRFFPRLRGR